MKKKPLYFPLGLRTIKTAVAVILSMLLVSSYGTTESRLVFAMLGAMTAVQPTFKESVQSSLTQIVGVFFGVAVSFLLLFLPLNSLVVAGIGIVLVITLYNVFHLTYSPGLPCFLVVMLCTTQGVQPIYYGLGRIWDTAIGLVVGMAINMLVFPYDNSRKIHATVESLDKELLIFLQELFDGDAVLPDPRAMTGKIDTLQAQLKIFANQKLLLRLKSQHRQLEQFRLCEYKARSLVAQLEVLVQMDRPGRLSEENRQRLADTGTEIADTRILDEPTERDVVTNYHVAQILAIRQQLLEALN